MDPIWLVKQVLQSLYAAATVGIIVSYGLRIEAHYRRQLNKNKLLPYNLLLSL